MKQASVSIPKNVSTSSPKIEPLFNPAFARIFGREESKPATRSLVNAVLQRVGLEPLDEIERIDAEHTATEGTVECKTPRMDVRIVAAGRVLDLEAQCYPEDVVNRSFLYGAQLLCENTPRGTGYKDLPQVVVITLLDAPPLFPHVIEYVHASRMHWDGGGDAEVGDSDRLLFVVVELSKVRKRYNRLTEEVLSDELLTWAYLLTKGYGDETEVERIMEEVPDISYFAELYGLAIDDPKVKRAFEDAVSAEREYQSRQDYFARLEREATERGLSKGIEQGIAQGIEQGIAQGIAQGVEQGREEERERIVARLRAAGADETLIGAVYPKGTPQ